MSIRTLPVFSIVLLLGACSALVDSFALADGSTHDSDVSLVNGSIEIGSNCRVNGQVESVNGGIDIGSGSRVSGISNVNGRVVLGENIEVDGDIAAVNGRIEIGPNSRVAGKVESVNGRISAGNGTVIGGRVSSVNGGIELIGVRAESIVTNNSSINLDQGAVISGDLTVRKSQGISFDMGSKPKIVVGRGVRVEGTLNFEREVELYVHESASVGEVSGAEPISYSGEAP